MSSSVIYLRFLLLLEPVLIIWILLENCHYHLGFYASGHKPLYSILSQFPNVLCNCSLFICVQSIFTDSLIDSLGLWSWKNPASVVGYLSPGEDIWDSQLGCLVLCDGLSALAWEIIETGSGMRSSSWHRGSLRLVQGVEENCIFLWPTISRKRDHPLLGIRVIPEHHGGILGPSKAYRGADFMQLCQKVRPFISHNATLTPEGRHCHDHLGEREKGGLPDAWSKFLIPYLDSHGVFWENALRSKGMTWGGKTRMGEREWLSSLSKALWNGQGRKTEDKRENEMAGPGDCLELCDSLSLKNRHRWLLTEL